MPKYKLNTDIYESLDEIIERYIIPCNNLMESVSNHKKFLTDPIDAIKDRLK